MKETINNIHVIAKGTIFSVILHMIVIAFLVVTGFKASLLLFSIVLVVVMGISTFYTGTISERYAEINGIIVSLVTSLLFLLYVNQYTEMDWAVNRILIASYLVIGFLFALTSRLTNKKQRLAKKEQEMIKKETREPKKNSNVFKLIADAIIANNERKKEKKSIKKSKGKNK
ncbi:hypothetical protein [Bacillus toyonensis]|uniref:hypothetical protein n=1 Tax=Bacillus toyonensis TaxID=155322 RepID=UPI002E1BD6AF|nr:hypothetical protein [Bacillus toyonensis]